MSIGRELDEVATTVSTAAEIGVVVPMADCPAPMTALAFRA